MGHKVNPTIFRLGISKFWPYQLRTNKNFIKNLFVFRFLKNLFMNYNIPVFNFKKHRNNNVNDKIVFRSEKHIIKSAFIRRNILFSHVFFGMVNQKMLIDSYFLDASIKQSLKKDRNPQSPYIFKVTEYKHWEPRFYKPSVLLPKHSQEFFTHKTLTSIKLMFSSKKFFVLNKDNKAAKVKSYSKLFLDLYKFLLTNFHPKYNQKIIKRLKNKTYKQREALRLKSFEKLYNFSNDRKKLVTKIKTFFYRNPLNKFEVVKKLHYYIFKLKYCKSKRKKKIILSRYKILTLYLYNKLVESNNKIKFLYEYDKLLEKFKEQRKHKRKYNKKSRDFLKLVLSGERFLRYLGKNKRKKKKKNPFNNVFLNYYCSGPRNRNTALGRFQHFRYPMDKSSFLTAKTFLKKKVVSKVPLNVFNFVYQKKNRCYKVIKGLKCLKYFFRSLNLARFFSAKKKIFFFQHLISMILNFMGSTQRSILKKKLFLVLQLCIYYTFSLSIYNILHVKKKYLKRFCFFRSISKTVFRSVQQLVKCNKLSYSVQAMCKYKFGSNLVLNYIIIKLAQHFNIHTIVNPLSYFMKTLTSIGGYKIFIRGRLSRKERAAVLIRSGKQMPLSTVTANVDYSSGFRIMKFGVVGIRVYLYLKPSSFKSLYKFTFSYAEVSK